MHEVEVVHEWRGYTTFEFDSSDEAEKFRKLVDNGGQEGLDAIVEAGDVFSSFAELYNWEAV